MDFDFLNKDAKNNKISKKDCFTTITSKSSQNFDVVANDKYSKTKNSSQSPLTPMSMNFLGSPKEEINDKKVVFLIKKQYIETLNCNICKIEFGFKLLASWKRKHCKICGFCVCATCSQRKINDRRVCDICILKIKSENSENRKLSFLDISQRKINNFNEKIKEGISKKNLLNIEKQEISSKILESDFLQLSELDKKNLELDKIKANDFELRANIRNNSEILQTLKKELQKIEEIIEITRNDHQKKRKNLSEKQSYYASKVSELNKLKFHLDELENSKSFANYNCFSSKTTPTENGLAYAERKPSILLNSNEVPRKETENPRFYNYMC